MTLRRLTFRSTTRNVFMFNHHLLLMALSTIESTFFCELVFELLGPFSHHPRYHLDWCHLDRIDMFLLDQFAKREDFRLIFRVEEVYGRETFQKHVRDALPSLERIGRIHFE